MTPALAYTRALLDQPPPALIPGQLTTDQEHTVPERPANFPALAVPCPTCQSSAGQLCTSHSGTRTRRNDVHQTRTAAHTAQTSSL